MSKIDSNEVVILEAVRTAFGRRGGALRNTRADTLLAAALEGLVSRSGVQSSMVGDVLAGCVSQAGEQGGNIARQALLVAGFSETVPGVTMNRMCGSSQYAVHVAAQAVGMRDMDFAIACGVENMSRVPMFLDLTLGQHDFIGFDNLHPDLVKRFDIPHQVESAELIAEHWDLTRSELDDYAVESHVRAKAARDAGLHAEIVPLEGVDKEGNTITLDYDEGIRDTIDRSRMDAMAPVFRTAEMGKVTAANASQMSDGAGAVLVGRHGTAIEQGLKPKAKFLARVVVGSDPIMQLTGIIPATHQALAKTGLTINDLDWIEVNEAFASVALSFQREFKPKMEIFNPWGGAIAHGHPLGGTGAGLMAKMLSGLCHVDGELGLQVMCIGHGMATATIVQRLG